MPEYDVHATSAAPAELTPTATGTGIRWHGTYLTRPELESVLPDFLQDFMQQMVDGLAARAAEVGI